jgi:hypothetical protein
LVLREGVSGLFNVLIDWILNKPDTFSRFGTIKSWMGATHFQMKTSPRVSTEMSLHVLAYNMKRAINLVGTTKIMAAI